MFILEIKVNDHVVEVINAVQSKSSHAMECQEPCPFMHEYIVNGTIVIEHARIDGHRELARKMLDAVKKFKK